MSEGERESDLGFHSLGELFDFAIEREVEFLDEFFVVGEESGGIEASGEPADFGDLHPFVEDGFFGDVADAFADFLAVGAAGHAEYGGISGIGFEESEEDAKCGGFSGPVFPEECDDLAWFSGEGDAVERAVGAVGFGDVGEGEGFVHGVAFGS